MMAHVEHFKRQDVKRLCNEYERVKREDGTWAFKPSGEIDENRTHLNYTMEPGRHAADELAARLAEPSLRVDKRRHVNVMSDWVITCPEELRDDPEQVRRFFVVAYDFMRDRYGKENVLQGYVHMDETSPHMHVPMVPVKDGRVSAKALYTRQELAALHTDLDAIIAKDPPEGFGRAGLIRNGRTKGDYTVVELKERTRAEDAARMRDQRQEALSQRLYAQQIELDDRRRELDKREKAIAARERAVNERGRAVRQLEGEIPRMAAEAARRAAEDEIEAAGREHRKPKQSAIHEATRQETIDRALSLSGTVRRPATCQTSKTL